MQNPPKSTPAQDRAAEPRVRRAGMAVLATAMLLTACAQGVANIKPTPVFLVQSTFCEMRVEGNRLLGPAGAPLLLHGADLPSIGAMEQAGQNPAQRVRELAQAGARIVRLEVADGESTATFPALKLAPLIKTANDLGMVVILANAASLERYNHEQYDFAEEWLREMGTYFGSNPGVWFEPLEQIKTISPLRRKNLWQRMTDITRGYRHINVILVSEPVFLNEADAELQRGVLGSNVVYAPRPGELRDEVLARVPHLLLGADGTSAGAVGAITQADAARFGALWKTSRACGS